MPGIDYLAKNARSFAKKDSPGRNQNIYYMDDYNLDPSVGFETPGHHDPAHLLPTTNSPYAHHNRSSQEPTIPYNTRHPAGHLFTTATPGTYGNSRTLGRDNLDPVQNFRHSNNPNYSELAELKQEVDTLKNDKSRMAQNVEELKSEINSFKCGLRAMLGDQPQNRDSSPQLYDVNKSVKMGQSSEQSDSEVSGANDDYEFLKDRVIQL